MVLLNGRKGIWRDFTQYTLQFDSLKHSQGQLVLYGGVFKKMISMEIF